MSRRNLVLAGLLASVMLTVLPPPSMVLAPPGAEMTPSLFEALEHRLMTALQDHDRVSLDELLADDYELTSADVTGERLGKVAYLQGAVRDEARIDRFIFHRIAPTIFGPDLALVRAELECYSSTADILTVRRFLVTDLWQRRGERWVLVSRHSTRAR